MCICNLVSYFRFSFVKNINILLNKVCTYFCFLIINILPREDVHINQRVHNEDPKNIKVWILKQFGTWLYEILFPFLFFFIFYESQIVHLTVSIQIPLYFLFSFLDLLKQKPFRQESRDTNANGFPIFVSHFFFKQQREYVHMQIGFPFLFFDFFKTKTFYLRERERVRAYAIWFLIPFLDFLEQWHFTWKNMYMCNLFSLSCFFFILKTGTFHWDKVSAHALWFLHFGFFIFLKQKHFI